MITDPAGGTVAGAAVTLRNQDTGAERQGESGGGGEYRFLLVPPGLYELRVAKDGFQSRAIRELRLSIGQTAQVDVELAVGARTEIVEVTTAVPLVETDRTNQGNTLQQEFVRNLPIDRRDYLSFTLLAPGVVDSNAMADNSDFRVAQTSTSGLSFYGSNGRGNSITVDGSEANEAGGGVRPTISQEAVEEFQVNRSNYTAELGGASGGVINIVSKRGGNDVRGSAFAFFRHQSLDAGDPFARVLEGSTLRRVKPDASRQQVGGSLGGPIRRDRTFLFGAAEVLNRDESNVVSILTDRSIFGPTPEQEAILSRLPAAAAGQLRAALSSPPSTIALFESNGGITPYIGDDRKFLLRLDHNASGSHLLNFRYSFAQGTETNASTRALVGSSRGTRNDVLDSTVAAGWTYTATASVVNDLRAQWNYFNRAVTSQDTVGPEFNINGFGFFGKDIFLPFDSISRRFEIKDTLAVARGRHTFRMGGQLLVRKNHEDSQTFFGGRFNFGPLPGGLVNAALASTTINALQAFNLGLPQAYQQGFGDPIVSATYPFYGVFAQDTWKVLPNLTLDIGLRYELDTRKSPLPTDKNNFAPRFGFAWDPLSDGKTSVRGGYGIFYSPIYFQIDYVVNALGVVDGRRQIPQVLTTIQTPGPAAANNIFRTLRAQGVVGVPSSQRRIQPSDLAQFGITVSQTGPVPPFSVIFENSPNYVNPYSQQATLSIEREIGAATSLSVSGIWSRTLKVTRARNRNLLPTAPVDPVLGIKVWRTQDFANPLIFQHNVYESSANAFYRGLIFEVRRRVSRSISLAANYTLSRAEDEVTDYNSDFQANDQSNLRAERSLSAFHQRHKFVVYGVWQGPRGVQLSPILRANSGRPFNLLVGADINADRHSNTDRPPGAGRNSGRGPSFTTLDLRISKRIGLGDDKRFIELLAEGFNLTNRLNYSSVNNTVGLLRGPFDVTGRHDRSPSEALGFTSAFDPRRIQIGLRLAF